MIVQVVVILAFLVTFGIFLGCVAVALIVGQRKNRREVQRLYDNFDDIVRRLGTEEGQ